MEQRDDRADGSRLEGRTVAERYQVLEKIGQGGMGEIYRARHLLIDKLVAIKVLHPNRGGRRTALKRFQQEARAAASIGNLHIVDVTDYGFIEDGEAFLVMEYLEGESLADAIAREGAMPAERVVVIASQILDGLGAAHEAGIVHRDLKSANVFLTRSSGDDLVKLLDFGISKIFPMEQATEAGEGSDLGQSPTWLTDTGIMVGTPHYMAPEQAEESRGVDHRADLYSLGVILYEMLTGELPFAGTNIWNVLLKHASEEPSPPRKRRPDLSIPRDLERVVLRAMSKDPDDRYPSAQQMLGAIQDLAQEEVHSGGPAPRTGRRSLDLRWVALMLVALAALGFLAVRQLSDTPRPEPTGAGKEQRRRMLPDPLTDFPVELKKEPPATPAEGPPRDIFAPDAGAPPDLAEPGKKATIAPGPGPRPPPKKTGKQRIPQKSDLPPNPYDRKR